MNDLAVKCVVGYLLIGAIITLLFWGYMEFKGEAGPDKPLSKTTRTEKIVITVIMLVLMSAFWIVIYPFIIILATAPKKSHNQEDDYK